MPVVNGPWVPNGTTNQRMRLVLDWSTSNTSDTVTRVDWTVSIEVGYGLSDSTNSFVRTGSWPAAARSVSINVASGGSQVLESSGADANREWSAGSRTLTFKLNGIEYVGSSVTASVSASIPIPARPISAPLAPSSISVTRVSDSAHTINWAASTSDARPISNFNLQWQTMGGSWATLGNPAASTRSWPSQSQQPNRAYRYRIRTSNSAGQSAWVTSGWVYNTPAAASSVSASRSGDNLVVSWTNNVWSGYGSNATHDVQLSSRVGSGSWSSWSNASGHTGLSRTTSSRSISGLDLTREWRARIVTRVPGRSATSSASGSVQFYNTPPTPTISGNGVARHADNDNRLHWNFSGSGTTAATSFTIQRWLQTDPTWRTVGNAGGSSRSWRDTLNLWDNRARWRVRANNPAGSSGWLTLPYQPGTPRGATTPTVARSGTNAILSWTNQARYSESISLWASSAPAGTTDWAPWAALAGHTGLSPSTTQRTITGLDETRLWRFQVHTHATTSFGTVLTGSSGVSSTLQLPAAPAAPTPLAPTVTQADGAVQFRWRHNPIDGSPQQAYEIRYRMDGGAWVTRTVTSGTQSHTETLDVGALEWQVRTRGQHASYSPWSGVVSVEVANRPAATILSPDGPIASNRVTLTWDYSDSQDVQQSSWRAVLTWTGGSEQRTGTTERTTRFASVIDDDTEVEITLWVTSGTGLESDPVSTTQLVHYLRPAQPIIYAEWAEVRGEVTLAASEGDSPLVWIDPEQGLVSLPGTTLHIGDGQYSNDSVEFFDHGEGQITVEGDLAPTELVRYERSDDDGATWVEVSGPVTLTDAVADWMVALNREPLYRAVAISDLEVEVASAPVRVSTATNRVWLHTAAGDRLSLEGNVELSPTIGADIARVRYLGDVYPTSHFGIGMDEQVAVTGTWFADDPELTTDDPIRDVLGRAVWFRDPSGRAWWASIDPVGGRQPWSRVREVSFTAVRSEAPRG